MVNAYSVCSSDLKTSYAHPQFFFEAVLNDWEKSVLSSLSFKLKHRAKVSSEFFGLERFVRLGENEVYVRRYFYSDENNPFEAQIPLLNKVASGVSFDGADNASRLLYKSFCDNLKKKKASYFAVKAKKLIFEKIIFLSKLEKSIFLSGLEGLSFDYSEDKVVSDSRVISEYFP